MAGSWTLVRRSLRYRVRSHAGTVLGAAVASAVLVGALVVGDSVRQSLAALALQRLGRTEAALDAGDRLFRASLPAAFAGNTPPGRMAAAALVLPGVAVRQDDTARANRITVAGVGPDFARFARPDGTAGDTPGAEPAPGMVWLNPALAAQLHAGPGDELVIRVHKPSALSRDAVITPRDDTAVGLRLRVAGIQDPAWLGNLSLAVSQRPPLNAFVRLDELSRAVGRPESANVILASTPPDLTVDDPAGLYQRQLREHWALPDAELGLSRIRAPAGTVPGDPGAAVLLQSPRIFLDPPSTAAGQGTAPAGLGPGQGPIGVLTYLVNRIRAADRATPYSMITATSDPRVTGGLGDDEVRINEWLADDLRVGPGDTVDLEYYVMDSGNRLVERQARFRVHDVVPLRGWFADPAWMPEFPGLARAESTRDWDAGFKLVHPIRDKDELYWKQHRGTPKAFLSLTAGQRLWTNRFGVLTGVRWYATNQAAAEALQPELARGVMDRLSPGQLGLQFQPVRARALQAAAQSQDFAGLFLGFSLFLIAAALLLMVLLFQFGLDQRGVEVGTLLALGFTPRRVRGLLGLEAAVLAAVGGGAGMLAGIGYADVMLRGLGTIWRDAVGTSALAGHARFAPLAAGWAASLGVAGLTLWVVLRRQARQTARELLNSEGVEVADPAQETTRPASRWLRSAPWAALAGAVALAGSALLRGEGASPGVFFGAGTLVLVAGLAATASALAALAMGRTGATLTLGRLGIRGCARRRRRSLAAIALLASGSFLVAAVGVFRLDAVRGAWERSSGTGGFALVAESALPVLVDLNTKSGREFFGLDEADMAGVSFVPMRVHEGDDASCLNLNRAQRPRLLGVRPELLADRGSFTFVRAEQGAAPGSPWLRLRTATGEALPAEIPAIGDESSVRWALGKKVGDVIPYEDEQGRTIRLRVVATVASSILQGQLLIDESTLTRLFPSEAGHRMFLIDAPSNRVDEVATALARGLRDVGLESAPAVRRLAAYHAVQNTYLGTFQALGGLGLILGSLGLGLLVLRNVLERRGELALLQAVGFRPAALRRFVLVEHAALLGAGLGLGITAAAVAVLPALLSPGTRIPYLSLGGTLLAVWANGLFWTWVAARVALSGPLLPALRNE